MKRIKVGVGDKYGNLTIPLCNVYESMDGLLIEHSYNGLNFRCMLKDMLI